MREEDVEWLCVPLKMSEDAGNGKSSYDHGGKWEKENT
jgi:hypothetical protein